MGEFGKRQNHHSIQLHSKNTAKVAIPMFVLLGWPLFDSYYQETRAARDPNELRTRIRTNLLYANTNIKEQAFPPGIMKREIFRHFLLAPTTIHYGSIHNIYTLQPTLYRSSSLKCLSLLLLPLLHMMFPLPLLLLLSLCHS